MKIYIIVGLIFACIIHQGKYERLGKVKKSQSLLYASGAARNILKSCGHFDPMCYRVKLDNVLLNQSLIGIFTALKISETSFNL